MSDFLSNFDPDNKKKEGFKHASIQNKEAEKKIEENQEVARMNITRSDELEAETDPGYKKRKKIIIGSSVVGIILCLVIGFFIYDNSVHVIMPDFKNKDIGEAKKWAAEYDVEFDVASQYSMKVDENIIISQKEEVGSRIRKGSNVSLTISKGPDLEAMLKLPNFKDMDLAKAEAWIKENKAINLKLVQEFSDEVEAKQNIKLEFKDSSITAETYKRKDHAVVYYSKGKEIFQKDIKVLNFVGKTKSEVETWAKTNMIEVTYVETDSDTIEMGKIISQSIPADEKVAKKDAMSVTVSTGKAIVVPNFSKYNSEQASMVQGVSVIIRKEYNANIPYGQLISQSLPAGKKLLEKDDKTVNVTYSEGVPYLKDYRTQTEGDLARLFFEDYRSKGANITYLIHYVSSSETRGTIVGMSNYNAFVPLDYTVEIYVSLENLPKVVEE